MTNQRKTAADYGQLSLFEETVPEWLQPVESAPAQMAPQADEAAAKLDDDDDLGQFTAWLHQEKQSSP